MMNPWLIPLLTKISILPHSFVGTSVHALELLLHGYGWARRDLGLPEFVPSEENILPNFRKWLAERHSVRDNRGWGYQVETIAGSRESIEVFFTLFDLFLEESGQKTLTQIRKEAKERKSALH